MAAEAAKETEEEAEAVARTSSRFHRRLRSKPRTLDSRGIREWKKESTGGSIRERIPVEGTIYHTVARTRYLSIASDKSERDASIVDDSKRSRPREFHYGDRSTGRIRSTRVGTTISRTIRVESDFELYSRRSGRSLRARERASTYRPIATRNERRIARRCANNINQLHDNELNWNSAAMSHRLSEFNLENVPRATRLARLSKKTTVVFYSQRSRIGHGYREKSLVKPCIVFL